MNVDNKNGSSNNSDIVMTEKTDSVLPAKRNSNQMELTIEKPKEDLNISIYTDALSPSTSTPITMEPLIEKSNNNKLFDWSNAIFRNVALKVSYIGEKYDGFTAMNLTAVENAIDYTLQNKDIEPPAGIKKYTYAEREEYWFNQGKMKFNVLDKSVEERIIFALKKAKLTPEGPIRKYNRCGRTDKGVSAFGQVISLVIRCKNKSIGYCDPDKLQKLLEADATQSHADVTDSMLPGLELKRDAIKNANALSGPEIDEDLRTEMDYPTLINRLLPDDIQILGWSPVPFEFSARFHCEYREYKYYFYRDNLNVNDMIEASNLLVGDHDFHNFCKLDPVNVRVTTRRIDKFSISTLSVSKPQLTSFNDNISETANSYQSSMNSSDDLFEVTIRGSSFLWHQVRYMMAVLFMVGKGHEKPDIVSKLLDMSQSKCKPVYPITSDLPLVLYDSGFCYPLRWTIDPMTQARMFRNFYSQNRRCTLSSIISKFFAQKVKEIQESENTTIGFQLDGKFNNTKHIPLESEKANRGKSLEDKVASLKGNKLVRYNKKNDAEFRSKALKEMGMVKF